MKRLLICLEHDGRVLFEGECGKLKLPLKIGRSTSCDWSVAGIDASMSSQHAELFLKRGDVWVRDMGSRNGITCTDGRITERSLHAGDRFHLGACVLTVEGIVEKNSADMLKFNRLEALNGPSAGMAFDLVDVGEVKIGSGVQGGILCPDPLVSREHAALVVKQDGSVWARDLGSRNGTTVNGTPLAKGKERLLRDGDILSVAYVEFRFIDRNVVHPRAHLLRKVLVAAATVAVAMIAYYTYATVRPSARMLLRRSMSYAEAGAFDEAFKVANSASGARGADAYVQHRRDVLANIEAWRKTSEAWRRVKEAIASRDWTQAQVESVNLVAWDWNSGTAPLEGVRAERALALVRALRQAQRCLAESEGADGLENSVRVLSDALEMFRDPKIAGNGAVEFAEALVADSRRVLPEIEATRRELKEIDQTVAGLKPADGLALPRGAKDVLDELGLLAERNRRRGAEALESGNGAFTPSRIVENRIGELRAPLRALVVSEAVFVSNAMAVAAGAWTSLETSLPLPSQSLAGLSDSFPPYSAWLAEQNAILCENVAPGWGARIADLGKIGIDVKSDGRPPILNALFSRALAEKALQFVPSPSTPLVRIVDGTPDGKLLYHLFVGMFDFADFAESVEADKSPSRVIASYGKVGEGWETVIEETRRVCQTMRMFRDYAAKTSGEAGVMARLVAKVRPESGENAIAAALAKVERELDAVEEWATVTFPELCRREGSRRAEVLGQGVRLLLMENPGRDDATRLADAWLELRRSIPRWDGEEATARRIFELALPGTPAHQKAWIFLQKEAQ